MKYALIALVPLLLAAGRVETRGGKTLEGAVTFADQAVVVRPDSGDEVRVPLAEIGRAWVDYRPAPKAEAGAPRPPGWRAQDIGAVKSAGSTLCDSAGVFKMTASGWGAWGAKDSFQFTYRSMRGDGQVIARVTKLDDAHGPVVAGVMIRQSLDPDAPMAATCLHGTSEVHFTRRPGLGTLKDFKLHDPDPKATAWVRLTRRADELTAFRSADGKNWQRVDQFKMPMTEEALVGVCAWTTGNAWTGAAQVDNVLVIPGTPGLTWFAGGDPLLQGIVFRDGSVLAATVVSANKTSVSYERGGKGYVTPLDRVARLVFSPVPLDMATPGRSGILLANGDFIDGEVSDLSAQPVEWPRPAQLKATVRSVLFGTRSFETARDVVFLDFAQVAATPAAYDVRTRDGSLVRAKELAVSSEGVRADGVLVTDVVEVHRL